jgi:MFS family permease
VAGMAPLLLDSLPLIVLSRVLVGAATAMIVTTCTVLIGDNFAGLRRARYLALQPVVTTIAGVSGLSVGNALSTVSWRAPYIVFAVGMVLLPFMTEPQSAARVVVRRQTGPGPRPPSLAPFLLLTVVASAIVSLPLVQTWTLVEQSGVVSGGMIAAVGALSGLAMVAGGIAGREVIDAPPGRALGVGFAVAALGFGFIGVSRGAPGIIIGEIVVAGLMLAGFGSGVLLPVLLVRTVGAVDYGQRGHGVGMWQAAYFGGQFVTPLAFTAISDAAGGPFAGLGAVAVLCLATAVVVAAAARRPRRWQRPAPQPGRAA